MSYQPSLPITAHSLVGNPTGVAAPDEAVTIDATLSLSGSQLAFVYPTGRTLSAGGTLQAADEGTSIVSSSASSSNLTLPAGLGSGFKVRHYQSGAGVVTYIAGSGASILNGTPVSGGLWSAGYYADIENIGGDVWVVTGSHA